MTLGSVIIPTRDRADLLARCLASLTRQTLDPQSFEVLVIDNGSTDHTAAVAASYADRLNLRCVFAPEPGLHVGRHAGMRAAASDVLIYADDDIEAEPTWVAAVVRAFETPTVALVGGNNHPAFESEPPTWLKRWWSQPVGRGRALGYLSVLDFGRGRFALDPSYVWGCNFSVRRQALESVGGFHPDGLPKTMLQFRGDGESYVAKALEARGWQTVFDAEASVHHWVPTSRMTQAYFEQRGYAQGVSDSYAAVRRNRGTALPLAQRVRAKVRPSLGVLREKWRALGAKDDAARELMVVRSATLKAWRRGFEFHQSSLRSDPALLDWVLKETYLA